MVAPAAGFTSLWPHKTGGDPRPRPRRIGCSGCTASSPPTQCDPNDPAFGDLDVNPTNAGTSITINGDGAGTTIIDANRIDRAFAVHTGGALTLNGVTIKNGFPSPHSSSDTNGQCGSGSGALEDGGAIYSDGGLTLNNDVLSGNSGTDCGGAVYSDTDQASTLSISGTTFSANSVANNAGGAIYDDSPNPATIGSGTVFDSNSAGWDGGAIYVFGNGGMAIDSTTFNKNAAAGHAGALYWFSPGRLTATHTTFSNNSAGRKGGAIFDTLSGGMNLTNDRIVGNSSGDVDGGALYLISSQAPQYTISQDEFDDNTSQSEGGAIDWYRGSLYINASSFVGNNTQFFGGALWADCYSCSLTMVNSTMSQNTAGFDGGGINFDTTTAAAMINDTIALNRTPTTGDGGGISCGSCVTTSGYTPPAGTTFTAGVENVVVGQNVGGDCDSNDAFTASAEPNGHNMDSDKSCFGGSPQPGDIVGANTNLDPPADNGGPSAVGDPNTGQTTLLTESDVHSPAVDAGTNTGCPPTDERGVTRPQGASCDIGAYEAAAAGLHLTKAGPASANAGSAFEYVITAANGGPGFSTGTTVVDTLPAGETLWGATPSQGTCSTSGSTLDCSLGNIASGSKATVTVVASDSTPGLVTNTAAASNDQGSKVTASASTQILPPGTPAGTAPTAVTGAATHVTKSSAVLNGQVQPGGQPTAYFFQYGTSQHYVNVTAVLHSGTVAQAVSSLITHLKAGTVYHYRLVAINDSGSSFGADRTFRSRGRSFLGSLLLVGRTIPIRNGNVLTTFKCNSTKACVGLYSITAHITVAKTHKTATVVCTKSRFAKYTIGAHQTKTVSTPVHQACVAAARLHGGKLAGKVSTRPRTAQKGLVKQVTLVVR